MGSVLLAERQVRVRTRDLFFRAKVEGILRDLGWEPVRADATHAVIELGSDADVEEVRRLAAAGGIVIAFGSHVRAELLRAARQAGATAVPNSQVEATLRAAFGGTL